MKEENLNNELTEEIVEELEEMKETEGGAGGYGNVEFECVCGREFLLESQLINHLSDSHHPKVKVFYQKRKGKGNRGPFIGWAKVTYKYKKVTIHYPNGAKKEEVLTQG